MTICVKPLKPPQSLSTMTPQLIMEIYRSTSFSMPAVPALLVPPKITYRVMNTAVITRDGTSFRSGRITAITAVPAISWAMILIKVPTELISDAARPALGPYSLVIIPTRVEQPDLRQGSVYTSASTRQAMPPPSVNHQADNPKWKASWAVPTVEDPPTKVPIMIPATIGELFTLPPAFFLVPDQIANAVIPRTLINNPAICIGWRVINNTSFLS